MNRAFELVLGTRNAGKISEIRDLFHGWPVRLLPVSEVAGSVEIEETGTTFAENAALKATGQARATGHWVLAEDSGLGVDALDGKPGVYSARFAGDQASDADNNALLMQMMADVPEGRRGAWYSCHDCLSDPQGNVVIACEGRCCGRIVRAPRGDSGFGYDPWFEVAEYHQTFAELGLAVKSVISHRAKALRKFQRQFRAIVETGLGRVGEPQ